MAGFGRLLAWWRILLVFLIVWLVVLLLSGVRSPNTSPSPELVDRMQKAFKDLQALKHQNAKLRSLVLGAQGSLFGDDQAGNLLRPEDDIDPSNGALPRGHDEPSSGYEVALRKLYRGITELGYYTNAEVKHALKQSKDSSATLADRLSSLQSGILEHKQSLFKYLSQIRDEDGYDQWREQESQDLSDLVQRRIQFLQNPKDCKRAKKLICNLNKGCGFGCQLHHAVYCFLVAYGTQRTLILRSKGWRYHKGGWEEIFKPVSDTCLSSEGDSLANWPGKPDTQVLTLPIIDSLLPPRSQYLPPAVPADLAPRLARIHGQPITWWVGQFLKYLLRPQPVISELLLNTQNKLGFKGPIVGIHIRRTDKVGTEAAFHPLDEYMPAVAEWFDQQISNGKIIDKRRIFLASDDPKVIAEARSKYPDYEILGDPDIAKTAAIGSRYSDRSLYGIIVDIHFLSRCDFLVCTFSSQVCRVAYEIMQSLHVDASASYRSLDDIYYYGGQNAHSWRAAQSHFAQKPEEIDLKIGDPVSVAGNHWDGFSRGRNLRTNLQGLFPSFKVEDRVEAVKFPTYPEVPLKITQDAPSVVET
ncbi:hypothetical protein FOCC_FOCC001038 [Frankliniella occidentalis]|uniref:Alpha-(1,6)-fucosyltransferase n=1 Tax=Frankliniella occidentalis TaxID=133901 RepID=A0A6J1SG56_FRAOC|nr:alpha-(1,6)-fucosyltransferase [Frankliniella occidentalis]KAE8752245.1 hypothetical protein FOCC_FOCC001038 [Frankliniella occidentalis]